MNDCRLDRFDYILIEDFIAAAKVLAPHQEELHTIDPAAFRRSRLDASDLEDYFFSRSEYLGGAASIITSAMALGIELPEDK